MKSILFVCLGNICRSPIAQGCAQKIIVEKDLGVIVDSAGTSSWHVGEAPCPNSVKIAKKYGVDISKQKARQVTKNDLDRFDLVVAMDDSNYNDLIEMGAKNIVKLGSYGYGGKDIPDPYFFNGMDGFDEVFKLIESCVFTLFKEI